MKRIIAGILITAAALCIGITSLFVQTNTCDTLCRSIDETLTDLKNENYEEVQKDCDSVYGLWTDKKVIFHIFTDHNEIINLEMQMAKLPQKKTDYKKLKEILLECENNINHIKNSTYPSLGNIF